MRGRKNTENERQPADRQVIIVKVVLLLLVVAALAFALNKLHNVWLQQCIVTNAAEQIEIESGQMVKGGLIAEICKLGNGVNLALLDYAALREDALQQRPELKSITFRRRLPNRLKVSIEERVPVVRLGLSKRREATGLVADEEGMVFRKRRDTGALPLVREAATSTLPGKKLGARAMAAIRLLEALRAPEYSELASLEADLLKEDYITLTFKNGDSAAKVAWAEMDSDTPESRANMHRQLRHLRDAVRTNIGEHIVWNATDTSVPGKIHAERKGTAP